MAGTRTVKNPSRRSSGAGGAKAPRSRAKRMTGEERKAQILDIAITMFGRHGFKGATTRVLATAAGVSEATIFKHFPTKAAIYSAAFDRRVGVHTAQFLVDLEELVERGDDQGLLQYLVTAVLYGYERDRDLHRMLLYAWLDQSKAENARLDAELQQYPLFDFLRRYIERRQAEGRFAPGNAAILTAALLGAPIQHAIRTRLYEVDADQDDEEVTKTLARFLLDGLRGRGS